MSEASARLRAHIGDAGDLDPDDIYADIKSVLDENDRLNGALDSILAVCQQRQLAEIKRRQRNQGCTS